MRRLRRIGLGAAGLLAAVLLLGTARPDPALFPATGPGTVPVIVVDHGYHAGLVIGTPALRAAAMRLARTRPDLAHVLRSVTEAHPHARWLEIGWGDAGFYRGARGLEDVTLAMAARALLVPSPSVLHVVPGWGPPERAFPGAARIRLDLSPEGVRRLAARLAGTFATDAAGTPRPDGPSLYGAGAFWPARPSYHALHTCNHWLAGLLRAAGVPSSWVLSATSTGLLAELRWRTLSR